MKKFTNIFCGFPFHLDHASWHTPYLYAYCQYAIQFMPLFYNSLQSAGVEARSPFSFSSHEATISQIPLLEIKCG